MDEHHLVAFDGSAASRAALRHALAEPAADTVTALYVVPSQFDGDPRPRLSGLPDTFQAETIEREQLGQLIVETASELAAERGERIETRIEFGSPPQVIADVGSDDTVDHVVVGSPVPEHSPSAIVEWLVRECPETLTLVRTGNGA